MPEMQNGRYVTFYEDDDFTDPWESKQTILIQHGFLRNSQFWYHWVPALARDYRVIRRDLRGHGRSGDGGAAPWTFDGLVDDLAGFIKALDLRDVHLLGESTGGMLAVGLATRHPGCLRSLTLCSSPTTISPAGQAFFAGRHPSWQEALLDLGTEGWARWLMAQTGTFPPTGEAQTGWYLRQLGKASAQGLAGYSRVISSTDVRALLPSVTVPTLLLAPTRSAATSMAEQESIAAALPRAELVRIDGVGHDIYIDRAEDCITAFRRFLAATIYSGDESAQH